MDVAAKIIFFLIAFAAGVLILSFKDSVFSNFGNVTLTATVTDVRSGDTIEVARSPIKIEALAETEHLWRSKYQARQALADLVKGKTVACEISVKENRDGVKTGTCFLNGVDIAETMKNTGLARN